MSVKIEVSDLSKVFGRSARSIDAALALQAEGQGKDEILARTGAVIAVSNVSLSVGEGEIYMVMGLSGSGKSTLIRCLNRLIEPTSGRVLVDGEDVFAKDARELREMRRTRISMVFQNFALLPHKTVAENVEFGLKVRGEARESRTSRAMETLSLVGLDGWENHYPENLSGGMQQRLGLARALANDPDILLMDEPFSALDPLIRADMQNELLELQQRLRKTIVFITHDFQEAIKLGDHIAIMKDGVIVQVGRPAELVARPADDYVVNFTNDIDRGRVFTAGTVMRSEGQSISEDSDCATASRAFNGLGLNCVFVLNGDGQPVGYLRERDVGGTEDLGRPVATAMATEFPCVSPDHHLADIYAYCDTDAPLAVVDDGNGRFLGYVSAQDILLTLAATGREEGEEPAGPREKEGRS